jgi:SAM-dependent methyltransferase
MLYIGTYRENILRYLPKNLVVAEIGVQAGDFSQRILEHMAPAELHLVDPWEYHEDEDYVRDAANRPQDQQDSLFEQVSTRFRDRIDSGQVKLHRARSLEIVDDFPDGYFDFVYIDAMHYYDAVLGDLRAFARKLRPEGLIAGHDFSDHKLARQMNFGVVPAVNEFVAESGFHCIALSGGVGEWFPSYFLSPVRNPDWLFNMVRELVRAQVVVLGLPENLLGKFHHFPIPLEGADYFVPGFR